MSAIQTIQKPKKRRETDRDGLVVVWLVGVEWGKHENFLIIGFEGFFYFIEVQ